MADIVKNPVSSAIYLEKKDAALLERLKKIHRLKTCSREKPSGKIR